MTIDYSKSKIYIIKSCQTDKIFLGATVKRLCERFSQHKSNYEKWMAKGRVGYNDPLYEILKFNDCQIQLLAKAEDVTDKDTLNCRLLDFITIYKDTAVNTTPCRKTYTPNGKPRGRPRKVKVPDNTPETSETKETPVETTA